MADNRYRFFLQNRFKSEQTVVTIKDGEAFLKVVPSLSMVTPKDLSKKDTPTSTLAYFDAMTCESNNIVEFLDALKVPLWNYKLQRTYIGYFGSKINESTNTRSSYLFRMKPAVNDDFLHRIAKNAKGSYINPKDDDVYSFIYDFFRRIESDDYDFVSKLKDAADNYDRRENDGHKNFDYNITKSLSNNITVYHNNIVINSGDYPSGQLLRELPESKDDLIETIKEYKYFRELYRFTKDYDLEQERLKEERLKQEQKAALEAKKAGRQKKLKYEPDPNQISLWDYMNSNKSK